MILGNPSKNGSYLIPYSAPQLALRQIKGSNLTFRPECDALMTTMASMGNITKSTLIQQIKQTAERAIDYVYDGPTADNPLNPIQFPNIATPGVSTVRQWFAANGGAQGLSQFNGYATWYRLDLWKTWLFGVVPSSFLIGNTGRLNSYAVGTVMHEIMHKAFVGGGFTHDVPPRDYADALQQAGINHTPPTLELNFQSYNFGIACFGDLQ
jgi:hypothetical protein